MCQQFTAWSDTSAMDSAHRCEILQLCSTAPHLAFYFFVRSHNCNDNNNVSCVSLGRAHQPEAGVAARAPRGLVRKSSPAEAGCHSRHNNYQQRRGGRGAAAGDFWRGKKERKRERGGVHPPPLLLFFTPEAPVMLSSSRPHPLLCWWTPSLATAARGEQPGELGHPQREGRRTQCNNPAVDIFESINNSNHLAILFVSKSSCYIYISKYIWY